MRCLSEHVQLTGGLRRETKPGVTNLGITSAKMVSEDPRMALSQRSCAEE